MTMEAGDAWLDDLATRMHQEFDNGNVPSAETLSAREFIGKFGWARRRPGLVNHIRNRFDELGMRTTPDFEGTYIDSLIAVELDPEALGDSFRMEGLPDPTHRVGMLDAANKKPTRVDPSAALSAATTIMLFHNFSQLPVMEGEYSLKGIISWESIGSRLSLGKECNFVRDCTVPAREIPITTPLFDAIGAIVEHGYVLVRDNDNTISGIVTASDLSNQFVSLAGPFLFLGQIEGHLRHLIHRKFTVGELQNASQAPEDIEGAADLTLGDYYTLFGKQENWQKLTLEIDRGEFIQHIDSVREIRNDVMHFYPDGLEDDDIQLLRDVARFFEKLVRMRAI